MMESIRKLAVIGLGKLGSPMAACFAAKGYHVIGTDVDATKVECINHGLAPVQEPQLQEYIHRSGTRLTASQDTADAVRQSDISFVIVPTPSDPEGGFSLKHLLPACESIGLALRQKTSFHVVVITSTVMPGSTEGPIRRTLEEVSGKRCGIDFGLCYSPEFIALGSVIRNYLHPDFILIGESDPRSGDWLESIYKTVCENNPPMARMNFVNAELTKISVNSFVTMKITYANTIGHLCQELPGANVDVVTKALGMDTRIGSKYLKGAVGFGGPCFPRDNRALAWLADQLHVDADLARATDTLNTQEYKKLGDRILRKCPAKAVVGILGLAYKPDTDVVEESQGLHLAKYLASQGVSCVGYDSIAFDNAKRNLDNWKSPFASNIRLTRVLREAVEKSNLLVVMLPNEEFLSLHALILDSQDINKVVMDCWRILDGPRLATAAEYVGLGVGPTPCPTDEETVRI